MIYRFLRAILGLISLVMYPVKVINKKNLDENQRCVVICNHYSSVDSAYLALKLFRKRLNCLSKQENLENKFVGWLFKKVGVIPVNRENPGLQTHKQMVAVLKKDQPLIIFPEGTRNRAGSKELAPLHEGAGVYACRYDAPVVPVLIHHMPKKWDKNYMIVGKPFDLSYLKNKPKKEMISEVIRVMTEKMNELRVEVDAYVAAKQK